MDVDVLHFVQQCSSGKATFHSNYSVYLLYPSVIGLSVAVLCFLNASNNLLSVSTTPSVSVTQLSTTGSGAVTTALPGKYGF